MPSLSESLESCLDVLVFDGGAGAELLPGLEVWDGNRWSLEGCSSCRDLLKVPLLSFVSVLSSTFRRLLPSSSPWVMGLVVLVRGRSGGPSAGFSGWVKQGLSGAGLGVGTWSVSGSWSSWLEEWSICDWKTREEAGIRIQQLLVKPDHKQVTETLEAECESTFTFEMCRTHDDDDDEETGNTRVSFTNKTQNVSQCRFILSMIRLECLSLSLRTSFSFYCWLVRRFGLFKRNKDRERLLYHVSLAGGERKMTCPLTVYEPVISESENLYIMSS